MHDVMPPPPPPLNRPEQHGEEMIQLVFSVLRGSSDSIAQRMMIEGLVALCNAEVRCVYNLVGQSYLEIHV